MNDLSLEGRVEALADEFLARRRAGERPTPEEYAARHPELAGLIRDVFPALALLEECGPGADAPAPERIGDFRVLRQIGAGGMGVVYEALEVSLGRHVALKVLPRHPPPPPAAVERFRREARAAAGLHHPHIVPVFGVGEHEGLPFCVMQFIRGQNLADVLRDVRGLRRGEVNESSGPARGLIVGTFQGSAATRPDAIETRADGSPPAPADDGVYFRSVARLGAEAAEGLDHAHRQGVLHRDVKPSNLLLDAGGAVWVADFGLAKMDGMDDLTGTGDVVGTLRYLAPERLSGRADARGDVYGLGLTLYEMATLRPAFGDVDRAQMLDLIRNASPPAPREIDRRVPRDLETIILKAIDKEPARRYQSAGEMADDLRRFLAGDPIRARPIGPAGRAWRWARRRPAMAGLAAAVTVLAFTLVAGVLWQWRQDVRTLGEKKAALDRAEASGRVAERALYRSRVLLADHEWRAGRVASAEAILDECPEELRGWEWHFLRRRCHQEARSFPVGAVTMACFTDGGKNVAVRLTDGDVVVLDADSGVERRRLKTQKDGKTKDRYQAAFSADGRLFACSNGRRVYVYNVGDGSEVCRVVHAAPLGLAFTPDGRRLLAGAAPPRRAALFDLAAAEAERTLPCNRVFAVDPGGKAAAVLEGEDEGATLAVLDLKTGARRYGLAFTGPFRHAGANALTIGAGGVLAVPARGGVRLVDGRPGHEAGWCAAADAAELNAAAYSPDGRWLVGIGGGAVRVWEVSSRRLHETLRGHLSAAAWAAFDGAGKRLVTASADGTVKIWERGPSAGEGPPMRGHGRAMWAEWSGVRPDDKPGAPLWLPGGRAPLIGVMDWGAGGRGAGIWMGGLVGLDLEKGRQTWRVEEAARGALAVSPDGLLVASIALDGRLQVRDARTGALAWVAAVEGKDTGFGRLAWSADGRRLAWLTGEKAVRVLTAGGEDVWRRAAGEGDPTAAAFHPDGRLALAEAGGVSLVPLEGGAARLLRTGQVRALAFSADGTRLATSGEGEAVRIWEMEDGRQVLELPPEGGDVARLRFSADGVLRSYCPNLTRWQAWDGAPAP